MRSIHWLNPRTIGLYALALTLVFIIACGGTAPAAPADPAADPAAPPTEAPAMGETPQSTPVAQATPVPPAPAVTQQAGTIDVGRAELQRFSAHPALAQGPNQVVIGMDLGEGLLSVDSDNEVVGMLAESWDISEDLRTWTFNLRQGVQFHKGYGEMTAEDVVWSMQGWGQNETHPSASLIRTFWEGAEATDRYTVVARPATPTGLPEIGVRLMAPAGSGTIVVSKQQADEIGGEAANRNTAATGPWEFVEDSANQYWRLKAVEDHWRQTPYFAELVKWNIPEESARIAGLQTNRLDTTDISLDSVPQVQNIPGVRLMAVPGALTMRINFYGGWYSGLGTEAQAEGYNPDLPWVSANPDPESEEWARAKMVRQALYLAIDWDAIADELFLGFATVDPFIEGYDRAIHLLGDRAWWEYNPERARELLAEAGYPNGFTMNVFPVMLRPFEPLTCEAMSQMWQAELGLDIRLDKGSYNASLRPQIIGRTYQGVTCHVGVPNLGPSQAFNLYHSTSVFNPGSDHPWLDAKIDEARNTLDPADRERLEAEIGQWIFDNALTYIAPFTLDAVWPVGPHIEEWSNHVRRADLRYLSGFEYVQPRQ
jgi:ABC-type transport system substrate-binding protein